MSTVGTPKGGKDQPVQDVMNEIIKSPSDTTIYAPALSRNLNGKQVENSVIDNNVINKISDFVARMRLECSPGNPQEAETTDRRRVVVPPVQERRPLDEVERNQNQARDVSDQAIRDAERFRANIEAPTGRHITGELERLQDNNAVNAGVDVINQELPNPVFSLNRDNLSYPSSTVDDQFFHITCHIDQAIKNKIEKGEFVELEKLLPKDPTKRLMDETRMELVNKDGATYFIPMLDREGRINNVR